MTDPKVLNAFLMGLNQDEATELQQLMVYLHEKAGPDNPSGDSPEGSIASIINVASPKVRQKMAMLSDIVETPRHAPFQEKWSEKDYFERMGMDVPSSLNVKSVIDGQEVASALQDRLGVDSDLPQEPLSDREIISAAYDLHAGAE